MTKRGSLIFFSVALGVKILIAGLFSSDFQNLIFRPFVNFFITNLTNPWQYFYENDLKTAFPYSPVMLYVLTPFAYIIKLFNVENIFLANLIFKVPTFLSDILIFTTLRKLFKNKDREIFIFYFFSLIILYACYAHSQLDLIPTSLLFYACYKLLKSKFTASAILLGLAITTKSNTLLALPFFMIFLYRNRHFKIIPYYLIIPAMLFLVLSAPFLTSQGFIYFVLNNPEQKLMFDVSQSIGNLKVYITPLLLFILIVRFISYRKINRDLLLSFLAIAFSVFILTVAPNPGWYIWGLPFFTVFFINYYSKKQEIVFVYLLTSLVYLAYFVFFYKHPLMPLNNLVYLDLKNLVEVSDNEHLKNLFFTVLEGCLCIILILFYRFGVRSNLIYKNRSNVTLIGVGGDSGAGKSTILKDIFSLVGEKNILTLEGDGDHKWERGDGNWKTFTHLNPKANDLHKQAEQLERLKKGNVTLRKDYDHYTGKFTDLKKIKPCQFIVLSGLHPFYLPKSRKIIDLKIYLDTDENLRKHWKVLRDKTDRGYSEAKVIEQIEARRSDSVKYIHPQKEYSDICIKYFTKVELGNDKIVEDKDISVEIQIDANLDLEKLLSLTDKFETLKIIHDYSTDLKKQILVVDGTITNVELDLIAQTLILNLEEIVPSKIVWESGLRGFIQLIVLMAISEVYKLEQEME